MEVSDAVADAKYPAVIGFWSPLPDTPGVDGGWNSMAFTFSGDFGALSKKKKL